MSSETHSHHTGHDPGRSARLAGARRRFVRKERRRAQHDLLLSDRSWRWRSFCPMRFAFSFFGRPPASPIQSDTPPPPVRQEMGKRILGHAAGTSPPGRSRPRQDPQADMREKATVGHGRKRKDGLDRPELGHRADSRERRDEDHRGERVAGHAPPAPAETHELASLHCWIIAGIAALLMLAALAGAQTIPDNVGKSSAGLPPALLNVALSRR